MALKDLCWAEKILGKHDLHWLQAPVWQANLGGLPPPISYSEILLRASYSHQFGLMAMCRAWRSLIDLVNPDLLAIDFGTTSYLATLGLGIPRVRLGASGTLPPLTHPLPTNIWWDKQLERQFTQRIASIENAVLHSANEVLRDFGQKPLSALHQLMECDDEFIFCSPALDQFPQRENGKFWGSIMNLEQGAAPNWPHHPGKRVFAYVKTGSPHFGPALKALSELEVNTVVHAPGISVKNIKAYESRNLTFSVDPVRMEDARNQCDIGICHAGAGTTEALLAAGKPVLLLPMQGEQESTSRKVEQLGAGLWVHQEAKVANFKKLIKRLLTEPSFSQKAQEFANVNQMRPQSERISKLVDRCEALIASRDQASN